MDEGGRLCDSSRCREVIPEVLGMPPGRPFIAGALRDGAFGRDGMLIHGAVHSLLPTWPEDRPALLSVRTRAWDAPCAVPCARPPSVLNRS